VSLLLGAKAQRSHDFFQLRPLGNAIRKSVAPRNAFRRDRVISPQVFQRV